jgi:hypothetical protein
MTGDKIGGFSPMAIYSSKQCSHSKPLFDSRRTVFATQAAVSCIIRTIDTFGKGKAILGLSGVESRLVVGF